MYNESTSNIVATALRIIGVVTIGIGIIAGCGLASSTGYRDSFNWGIALGYWGGSLIGGIVFIGFAEIITLLQAMVDKMDHALEKSEKTLPQATSSSANLPIPTSTVSTEETIENDTSDAPVFSPETLSKAPSELLDSINALSACKGFVELFSVWKQNGLDKVETLTKYTKEIAHQASIERMFGSMPADAARRKQFIQDMINELQTKA